MKPSLRRSLYVAIAPLACALALAAGCSRLDDFTAFRFDDGGAGDGGSVADLAGSRVGDPCGPAGCTGGLSCVTTVGGSDVPGGICSASCDPQAPSCPAGSGCAQTDGASLCLAACNPSAGVGCRTGWSCCDGQRTVSGSGLCAPSNGKFCGH